MTRRRLSMLTLQIGVGSLLTLSLALTAGFVYAGYLQRDAERLLVDALQARGQVGMSAVNSRLLTAWETTNQLAKVIDANNSQETRRQLTFLRQAENRWHWLGLADLEGRIVAASDGSLEGERASATTWFRRGLIESTGDQLDTGLLSNMALRKGGDANRSIILSTPVRDSNSNVIGVLGVQLSWPWLAEQIASISSGNVDVLLVARDNSILLGPPMLIGKLYKTNASFTGTLTTPTARIEHWPDGQDYVTMVFSSSAFHGLPNLGWHLVLRQDLASALGPTRELTRQFWTILIATIASAIGVLVFGTIWLVQPLRRLVRFGNELIEGRANNISHEETRYEEATQLSAILTQLQLSMLAATARGLRTASDDQQSVRLVTPSDRLSN